MILMKSLLQSHGDELSSSHDAHGNIQLAASITANHLSIIFRRNIEGIIQRLGEVTLDKNVAQEIELFDWLEVALNRSARLEAKLQQVQSRVDEQKEQMQKLSDQLEDFVEAKQHQENDMLGKFQRLLNEKKLKIRDQQRILNASSVAQAGTKSLQAHQQSSTSSPALEVDRDSPRRIRASLAESRASKRKAQTEAVKSESEDEDDFERMGQPDDETDSGEQTPEAVDEPATTSEDSDEDRPISANSAPSISTQRNKTTVLTGGTSSAHEEGRDPPPRRNLPFVKQSSSALQPGSPTKSDTDMDNGEETTDDDEL